MLMKFILELQPNEQLIIVPEDDIFLLRLSVTKQITGTEHCAMCSFSKIESESDIYFESNLVSDLTRKLTYLRSI